VCPRGTRLVNAMTAPVDNITVRQLANGEAASATIQVTIDEITDSQIRAIRAIAARLGLDANDACQETASASIDQLTLKQASAVIDALKSRQAAGAPR